MREEQGRVGSVRRRDGRRRSKERPLHEGGGGRVKRPLQGEFDGGEVVAVAGFDHVMGMRPVESRETARRLGV